MQDYQKRMHERLLSGEPINLHNGPRKPVRLCAWCYSAKNLMRVIEREIYEKDESGNIKQTGNIRYFKCRECDEEESE